MTARRRMAALLEVLGVFLAGPLLAAQLVRLLGVTLVNPLEKFRVGITDAELVAATGQMFVLLVVQYAGYFLLIIPINYWHRRRGPAAYGLTLAGRSWRTLIAAGLATTALTAWPVFGLQLVDAAWNLGETAPWRQALLDTSWRRWEFWLFTAVCSWALVAFLEELFFRGYCQRRLAEDWGDGAAIIGTASLFIFTHGQYLTPNAYNAGMVATLLVLAIGFGVVFAWTRSLVPSVIAHAIVNVPMTPLWQSVMLTALAIGAVVMSRRGVAVVKQVFSGANVVGCLALAVAGMGWAIAAPRVEYLGLAAIGMILVGVGLCVGDRDQPSRD